MLHFSKWILIAIAFLIPFQDLINSIFYKVGFPNAFIFLFGILKEILISILAVCFAFYNRGRIPKKLLVFYLIIFYTFFLFVFNNLPLEVKFGGLRQYLLLFFSVIAGYFVQHQNWIHIISSRLFAFVLILFVVFCFLQHFILPLSIFGEYFPILEMKRNALRLEASNEYYNTGLPVNYMGEAGPRMLGPFNEPLYTAYFALPFFNYNLWAYLESKKSQNLILTVLFLLIIMLSQTRAVILVALLYLLICFKNKFNFKLLLYSLVGGFFVLSFKTEWIFSLVQSLMTSEGRSADHFLAYVIGINLILNNPWGTGLGSGAAISTFLGGNNAVSLSVENAFINTSLDLGVFITLVLLATLIFNYWIGERSRTNLSYKTPSPYNALILQFVLMGFLAPHILTIRVIIPYMFIIGLAIKESYNENLHYNYNYNR